uniref:Uncharacterized protein n=1 Tax=Calidris pygmaea TaxID=425635 RepID=A0A8C3J2B2_9CHAR
CWLRFTIKSCKHVLFYANLVLQSFCQRPLPILQMGKLRQSRSNMQSITLTGPGYRDRAWIPRQDLDTGTGPGYWDRLTEPGHPHKIWIPGCGPSDRACIPGQGLDTGTGPGYPKKTWIPGQGPADRPGHPHKTWIPAQAMARLTGGGGSVPHGTPVLPHYIHSPAPSTSQDKMPPRLFCSGGRRVRLDGRMDGWG